jgi:hypothetical protein
MSKSTRIVIENQSTDIKEEYNNEMKTFKKRVKGKGLTAWHELSLLLLNAIKKFNREN